MSGFAPTSAHGELVEPCALPPALRQAQDERKGNGSLRIAGYAALFDRADGDGDVIRKGAFARSIAERGKVPLPFYWQHRPEQRIGVVERVEEDDKGLRVIARIDNAHGRAAKALELGEVNGLSFGYRARGYRPLPKGRLLEEIELLEVSLVTHPLQPGARVHFLT